MRIYNFDKWFFDCLLENGDYIFFFIASANIFNRNHSRLSFFYIPMNSTNIYTHTEIIDDINKTKYEDSQQIEFKQGHLVISKYLNKILINSNKIKIDFRIKDSNNFKIINGFLEITNDNKKSIKWSPIILRGEVTGSIQYDDREIKLNQLYGYSDHLYSNLFPFKSPVKQLYWGRMNSEDVDLTFSFSVGKNKIWKKLIIRYLEKYIMFSDFDLNVSSYTHSDKLEINYPDKYIIKAHKDDFLITIKIEHVKKATESSFILRDDFNNSYQYNLFKLLSRDPKGLKFFARAEITIIEGDKKYNLDDILLIDEYVKFN